MPLMNRFRVFIIGISTPSILNQYFALIIPVLNSKLTIGLNKTRKVIESVQPTSLSLIQFSIKKSTVCFPYGSAHNDIPGESCVFIINKIQYIIIRLRRTTQIEVFMTW